MAFSKEDQAKAKADKKVLVGLFVNGKAVDGFPYQSFSRTESVSPARAKAIIADVTGRFDGDEPGPSPPK